MLLTTKVSPAVYPRVGGGNRWHNHRRRVYPGLSPRGRGKRGSWAWACPARRSIPAWAGETRRERNNYGLYGVYPRVGGGNRPGKGLNVGIHGLSPRGRGKPSAPLRTPSTTWSIPAWAGETGTYSAQSAATGVYPRVGGGNYNGKYAEPAASGLSPRGRGKPAAAPGLRRQTRSIPAWAGETPGSSWPLCWTTVYPRVGGGNAGSVGAGYGMVGLSPRGRGKLL